MKKMNCKALNGVKRRSGRYPWGLDHDPNEGIVLDENGYEMAILLDENGVWQVRPVHKLVAEAFVPNPEGKKNIRHKDGDIRNNQADNLEWVD